MTGLIFALFLALLLACLVMGWPVAWAMAGGVVLRDGKVETNCSFEMLLRLQREPMAAEVARVLFDEA